MESDEVFSKNILALPEDKRMDAIKAAGFDCTASEIQELASTTTPDIEAVDGGGCFPHVCDCVANVCDCVARVF